MVEVTVEASGFINQLLVDNEKQGHGIKVYVAGMGCSGPQFGMAFQEAKEDDDIEEVKDGYSLYYDEDASDMLKDCIIEYIETTEAAGLIVKNPNASSCGDSCSGCH